MIEPSHRRRLNRCLGLAIALLLVGGLVAYSIAMQQVNANRRSVDQTYEVLIQVEGVQSGISAAQESRQSYILTGNPEFLEHYNAGVQQALIALPQLEQLLAIRLSQQRFANLQPLIQARFDQLERSIELFQRNPSADAVQAALTRQGTPLQQQIQTQLTEIQQSEKAFLQEQTNAVESSLRSLAWIAAIFFSLSFGLLLLIYLQLRQESRQREKTEDNLRQTNEQLKERTAELQQELGERQRIEATLRQSEAQFRSLSEYSPIGILLLNAQRECVYANPRYLAIAGCTAETVLGQGWLETVHPDDRSCVEELLSSDAKDGYCEIRFCLKDGTVRHTCLYLAPVFDSQHQLISYVGAAEDITERRQISQMKDEFISMVSHELRTPLSSIQGSLGLLAAGVLDDQPDTAKQMLEIATLDTERLARLVNDILDLNRLEAGKVELNRQWCSAVDLVKRALDTVQAIADESQITLSSSVDNIQLWADADWIIQTLVNLLSNAIKASPPHSTIEIAVQTQEGQFLFQVKDQGRGIPADKLEVIFCRFQQLNTIDGYPKRGTGLGLSICRHIVDLHGGRIWAESELGKGSTFFFTLPLPEREP